MLIAGWAPTKMLILHPAGRSIASAAMLGEESPDNNEHPAPGIQGTPGSKYQVMDSVAEKYRLCLNPRDKGENAR